MSHCPQMSLIKSKDPSERQAPSRNSDCSHRPHLPADWLDSVVHLDVPASLIEEILILDEVG